ncbi:MAG: AEC family transporter [Chloroflexi bacterium]|jgi:predicted permease|nr:AEC family transporter [Chloroflexota bacterium]
MLNSLPTLFLNNLVPILLVAGIGYLLGRWLNVDPRSVSRVVFYALSPFLIFDLLANSELSSSDFLRIGSFAVFQILTLGIAAWIIGRLLKLERKLFAATLLTVILINGGNYGLSLNLFAFGEAALAHASIYFVVSAIAMYTAGVAIASMGTMDWKRSLLELLKTPTIYGVIVGMTFNSQNWELPLFLNRTVSLLSDATIPSMLLVLGLQLQNNTHTWNFKALALSASLRLLAGPALAIATAGLFGLQGVARQAGILEASMPPAVMCTILATEYDVEPAFVTTVVFVSTLVSPLTLTPLLAYLGA